MKLHSRLGIRAECLLHIGEAATDVIARAPHQKQGGEKRDQAVVANKLSKHDNIPCNWTRQVDFARTWPSRQLLDDTGAPQQTFAPPGANAGTLAEAVVTLLLISVAITDSVAVVLSTGGAEGPRSDRHLNGQHGFVPLQKLGSRWAYTLNAAKVGADA
ncbi:hypothetical protein CF392_02805 [Tamilnaduibacter salinus]|uniref:Uncharacterized protein n=1 Tax=Tamilnaduibacter salinus TaxID=1484056 RepID=A0A2A2I5S1_9GAMM|nr:hypothetical protein CF392_02805 [Tamilnaduibacter salinus]